jgi:enamine deaminase RidA (YjgF/YER057c/UK114 family)
MNDADVLSRLQDLDLVLPAPPQPLAAYVPCIVEDGLAVVSGQIPMVEGQLLSPGLVGRDVTVDEAATAARRGALQAVSVLRATLGSFDRLDRIVQVSVFVAAVEGFIEHPQVANGASELLSEVFGDLGRHARIAVGAASLPLGASVEVALTASVSS